MLVRNEHYLCANQFASEMYVAIFGLTGAIIDERMPLQLNALNPETFMNYPDGRPVATLRMEAKDRGIILPHGCDANKCDDNGVRNAVILDQLDISGDAKDPVKLILRPLPASSHKLEETTP
jgi:hypothetical protein